MINLWIFAKLAQLLSVWKSQQAHFPCALFCFVFPVTNVSAFLSPLSVSAAVLQCFCSGPSYKWRSGAQYPTHCFPLLELPGTWALCRLLGLACNPERVDVRWLHGFSPLGEVTGMGTAQDPCWDQGNLSGRTDDILWAGRDNSTATSPLCLYRCRDL